MTLSRLVPPLVALRLEQPVDPGRHPVSVDAEERLEEVHNLAGGRARAPTRAEGRRVSA